MVADEKPVSTQPKTDIIIVGVQSFGKRARIYSRDGAISEFVPNAGEAAAILAGKDKAHASAKILKNGDVKLIARALDRVW